MPCEQSERSEHSEQRLHPASILFAFGRSVRTFALPGLLVLLAGRSSRGPVESFGRLPGGWEVWAMLLMIPAAVLALARYLSFRVRYESADLVIRSGLVFRNERHIPYARIQNLKAVRNLFHRALGVVEVQVENAAGKETEATISVIPDSAFEEMRRRVLEGRAHGHRDVSRPHEPEATDTGIATAVATPDVQVLLELSPKDLLLLGFLENRGLIIFGALFGYLWEFGQLDRLLGRLAEREVYGSGLVRETVSTLLAGHLPPLRQIAAVVAGIAGLLVLVRVVSMVWALLRLHGFRLTRTGNELRTEYGLFTRVSATIPLSRVQTLTIYESPLARWLGRAAVRVETAGGGGQASKPGGAVEREWLAPIIRTGDLPALVHHVVPELDLGAIDWQPVHPRAFRRVVKRALAVGAVIAAGILIVFGWRGIVVLPLILGWFVLAARKQVDRLGWTASDRIVAFRSGWIWRGMTVARIAKIQAVAWRESPFDRRAAMARVRVDTAGASERSIRVDIPYLPLDVARELHRRLAAAAGVSEFRW